MCVLRCLNGTELDPRQSAGFGLGHPALHVVVHGQVQVRLGFLVELAVEGVPSEKGSEARPHVLERAHPLPPSAASTRPITATSRSHCDLSPFIRRLPALVIA